MFPSPSTHTFNWKPNPIDSNSLMVLEPRIHSLLSTSTSSALVISFQYFAWFTATEFSILMPLQTLSVLYENLFNFSFKYLPFLKPERGIGQVNFLTWFFKLDIVTITTKWFQIFYKKKFHFFYQLFQSCINYIQCIHVYFSQSILVFYFLQYLVSYLTP